MVSICGIGFDFIFSHSLFLVEVIMTAPNTRFVIWDSKSIEDELVLAFVTLRKVPHTGQNFLRGLHSHHPETCMDEAEKWVMRMEKGFEEAKKNRVRLVASPADIDAMYRAFAWFWLDIPVRQRKIIGWGIFYMALGRQRIPWRQVSKKSGIFLHRATMRRLYNQGLVKMARSVNQIT